MPEYGHPLHATLLQRPLRRWNTESKPPCAEDKLDPFTVFSKVSGAGILCHPPPTWSLSKNQSGGEHGAPLGAVSGSSSCEIYGDIFIYIPTQVLQ